MQSVQLSATLVEICSVFMESATVLQLLGQHTLEVGGVP